MFEFYLNQKSLPMIRKCFNCKYFNKGEKTCRLMTIYSAYDYTKNKNVEVEENNYCPRHRFVNEQTLAKEAVVVQYPTIQDAMNVIHESRMLKGEKSRMFGHDED